MLPLNRWLLTGARVAQASNIAPNLDIYIENGRICSLQPPPLEPSVQFEKDSLPKINSRGMLILPGLINAHDHLEFALFPRLGTSTYPNAKEWALDIYHPDWPPIRELLQVPKPTRLFWGGLKNLLSGVTTVCHHNCYEPEIFESHFPVHVLKRFGWTHSFDFSKDVGEDFRKTPKGAPFFIHLAEGTDAKSREELQRFDRLGLLNPQTVIIHGVALNPNDWELVKKRRARLVWCPSSNLFTLGKTLESSILQSGMEVALGNDSPLTAAGDLLDEIHCATQLKVPPHRVYQMVTESAARLMSLVQGEGRIFEGGAADLILVKDVGVSPAQRLSQLSQADIELVLLRGQVMLASTLPASQLPPSVFGQMQRLLYSKKEFYVAADISRHWAETVVTLGDKFRLGGKEIRLRL